MGKSSLVVAAVALAVALGSEARGAGLYSCEAGVLAAAAVHSARIGRCHARALRSGDETSPRCLRKASRSLAKRIARLAASGCDTEGFGEEIESSSAGFVETLAGDGEDAPGGRCASKRVRAVSRAASRGLRALARHRERPNLGRLGRAERRIRSSVERVAERDCAVDAGAPSLIEATLSYVEQLAVDVAACAEATLPETSMAAAGVPFCPAPFPEANQVRVSLADERAVSSRFGVLGFPGIANVPDALAQPLRPRLIRTVFDAGTVSDVLEKAEFLNVVLSDSYGYPPGWPVAPYEDIGPWLEIVRSILEDPVTTEAMREHPERLIFEPWNEPNTGIFWDGTLDQATDLWIATEQLIRSVYPDAMVAGPSYVSSRPFLLLPGELEAFLDRAIDAGSRVDYLVWHGFEGSVSGFREALHGDIEKFITDSTYSAAGLKGLLINEYPVTTLDLLPAENLGFLEALEADEVLSGARACWGGTHQLADAFDPSTWTNCTAGNLNGLLMPEPDFRPRSVWWVYRLVADGLDRRVRSSAEAPGIVTVIGANGDAGAKILVGHIDDGQIDAVPTRAPIDIAVRITGVAKRRCTRTTIQIIPDTRSEPLESLETLIDTATGASSGTLDILLKEVPSHEVRVIELSRCD